MANPLDLLNFARDAYQRTNQPLKERGLPGAQDPTNQGLLSMFSLPVLADMVAPVGTYEDGSVGPAVPKIVQAGIDGVRNFGRYGYDTPEAIEDNARNSFDAAGLAMTGGLTAAGAGMVDNAAGAFGGRLKPFVDDAAQGFKLTDELVAKVKTPREDIETNALYHSGTVAEAEAMQAGERQAPQGIRAYHGSPADFDRFSLDKIGTGEGSQAYGHGLYFADSEDVAKSYRDQLSGDMASQFPDEASALEAAGPGGKAFQNVFGWAAIKADGKAVSYNIPGRMYEVNIRANPEDFLDWDKPLAEQPEAVRQAYLDLIKPRLSARDIGPDLVDVMLDRSGIGVFPKEKAAEALRDPTPYLPTKGSDLVRDEAAMQALREAGIPGIRYLDGMSRDGGTGTSNYVVFDDQLIDILRKYANAPTGAAIPIGMEASQDDSEAALMEVLRQYGLIQ